MSRGNLWPGLVVVGIALASHAWVPWLSFQHCDYDDIPDVGWMVGVEPTPASEPGGLPARSASYLPAFWAVLWALRHVGSRASPAVFHLFFLCSHAAASWLLYRIVSVRVGRLAGVIGGGLFAILPGGIDAVSWVAAGGHQLAVLFMLAAAVAGDQALLSRSRIGVVLCGAATFCAVFSKETALALLPALAISWLCPPAGVTAAPRLRISIVLASLGGVAAAWILRARVMGIWVPDFPGGARFEPSQLAVLPRAFLGFLLPWNRSGEFSAMAPASIAFTRHWLNDASTYTAVRAAVAVAALAPVVIGFVVLGWRARVALLALAAALVAAIVPVLPLSQYGHLSRAWYSAAAVFATLVACASLRSTRRGLGWACVSLIPLGLISLDGLVHVARTERHVSDAIRFATQEFEKTVGAAPEMRFIVLDPPADLGGTAFLGPDFVGVISPPFGTAPFPATEWPSARSLSRCPAITLEDHAIQLLAWNGRRLGPRGAALPPIPRDLPGLRVDPKNPSVHRPVGRTPPRGIAGLRLKPESDDRSLRGVVTWMAGKEVREVPFARMEGADTVVGFPDAAFDDKWATAPMLDGVRIEGVAVDGPPALLRRLPTVEILSPVRRGFLFIGVPPRITFASATAAPIFRVTFEFILPDETRVPIAWTFPASELLRDPGGNHVFVAEKPASVKEMGGTMTWTEISAKLAPHVTSRGWGLGLDVRVEALDASGLNTIARSEWCRLVLIRKP